MIGDLKTRKTGYNISLLAFACLFISNSLSRKYVNAATPYTSYHHSTVQLQFFPKTHRNSSESTVIITIIIYNPHQKFPQKSQNTH